MRISVALWLLLACAGACHAGEIRNGAHAQVKADSIWFQDAARLARWQALKKAGDAAALAAYQHGVLKDRDAWQFLAPLEVRIRSSRPELKRVEVEMTTEGRMKGSTWLLDADALAR